MIQLFVFVFVVVGFFVVVFLPEPYDFYLALFLLSVAVVNLVCTYIQQWGGSDDV